jgi:hypothetical protein
MELTDLLRYVVDVLEKLSIPYLVTGSTAGWPGQVWPGHNATRCFIFREQSSRSTVYQ